jgi:hypothetical protein
MTLGEVLTIIALVIAPIFAVLIGQNLQDRAKKREEKMSIFKVLMTARIYGWTENGVQALNMIDIVFSDSIGVRNAWKEYRDSLNVVSAELFNTKDAKTKQYKLLEAISDYLGYKGEITWETIQNPYIPEGLYNMWEEQSKSRKDQAQTQKNINDVVDIISIMSQLFPTQPPKISENESAAKEK